MGLLLMLMLGLGAILLHLCWSGGLPLFSAVLATAIVHPQLKRKWHVYWIVPLLNTSVWEFFLRDQLGGIYFGWTYGVLVSLVAALAVHTWKVRRGEVEGLTIPPLDLLVKLVPIVVFFVGLDSAPPRLNPADFDPSAAKMSEQLPPQDQTQLDNALKLLFARAKCYLHCSHPSECHTFGLFHRGKTASQLIDEGRLVAEDIRLNYGCRIQSLDGELATVRVSDAKFLRQQPGFRPQLRFQLKNRTSARLRSLVGVVSVDLDSDTPVTNIFCCDLSGGLPIGESTDCVVRLRRDGWRRGGDRWDAPHRAMKCEVVIQGVISDTGILDLRPLMKEKERCIKIVQQIDERKFDYGWRHLNVDPQRQQLHGPNADLVALRSSSSPFFPDQPAKRRVRCGEFGHLQTGYTLRGRIPPEAKQTGFVVDVGSSEFTMVGYRLSVQGDFELFFFPRGGDGTFDPNRYRARIRLDHGDGVTQELWLEADAEDFRT